MKNRILCDDGNCIGVIDPTGFCKICGRPSKHFVKKNKAFESEWSHRTLCIDGNCIGVIGKDGRCKECGKEYIPEKVTNETNSWSSARILCDDGCCIGVLDTNGRCKECGLISSKFYKNKHRIFRCPSCNQKLRVPLPLPKVIVNCKNCHIRFQVSSDDSGNLCIFPANGNNPYPQPLTIDDCFPILQVNRTASHKEIKTAYRKRMLECHPDKVSMLGEEFKVLAERKAKQINSAFEILKKHGYLD